MAAMPSKIPWLPSSVQPGQKMERCPRCGARAFFPWTLQRNLKTMTLMRTWVCTECQVTEERPEAE
jgi:DNA-directed RNA polymerase subunit M/transcription elongation factor TFIIS